MVKSPKLPNFEVPREALMTWPFAKIGGPDLGLANIRFEMQNSGGPGKTSVLQIHAVASDGTHMIHVWWEPEPTDVLPAPIEIEADAVKFLLGQISKGGSRFAQGKDRKYRMTSHEGRYILSTDKEEATDAGPVFKEGVTRLSKWRDVIPKRSSDSVKHSAEWGLDLAHLTDFTGFLKEFSEDQAKVKLYYADVDCLGPVLFVPTYDEPGGQEIEYVLMGKKLSADFILMPCRI
jgi:hypothetical protein